MSFPALLLSYIGPFSGKIRFFLVEWHHPSMNTGLRERFLKIYSTLPLGVRKEIILVLDDPIGPISWEVAFIEVDNSTPLSETILQKLEELQII